MKKYLATLAVALVLPGLAQSATVTTVFGVAVTGNKSHTEIDRSWMPTARNTADINGINTIKSASGGSDKDVVGYMIPLSDDSGSRCTYGDMLANGKRCGMYQDYGDGGPKLDIWFKFSPLKEVSSTLHLYFEDLDVEGFNDPSWFREYVRVHNSEGERLELGPFTSPPSDYETQTASVDLGVLTDEEYWVRLRHKARSERHGYNTPEFVIAAIKQEHPMSVVPLPAAGWLLLAGVGGLATMGARRRKREEGRA